MPRLVTASEARLRRYPVPPNPHVGGAIWVTSYIGMSSTEARAQGVVLAASQAGFLTPTAYLTTQSEGTVIPGHFHQADQFQVFVNGNGRFGSKRMQGASIHYAGAFTPYAAIEAGTEPSEYFVLRTQYDPGPRWMPQSRPELRERQAVYRAEFADVSLALPSEAGSSHPVEEAIPADETGLGAWVYRLNSGDVFQGPEPSTGRAQFAVVLKGQCFLAGQAAEERSLCYVAPDEAALSLSGDLPGAIVVLVQFAKDTRRFAPVH